jgi:hypothetical protein
MLTRAEQIRKALALLASPPERRDECRRDIEHALDRVKTAITLKADKAGLQRYVDAMRWLRAAYQKLNPAIRPFFSLSEVGHIAGKPTHIDREIAQAEAFLGQPSPRSRARGHKAAVAASNDLLRWWGRTATTTRRGEWAQLAGILAGDQTVDLYDLMRAYKHSNMPPVEKLRGEHSVLYRRPVRR